MEIRKTLGIVRTRAQPAKKIQGIVEDKFLNYIKVVR